MSYKTKSFAVADHSLEVKADVEKRRIEGYAAVSGVKDSHEDVIVQGAFKESIERHWTPPGKSGFNRVRTLWQHDRHEPIGRPDVLEEDSKGLFFASNISKTPAGDKALILVADKVIDEMSFGFDIEDSEMGKHSDGDGEPETVQFLKKLGLWEVSPVTWGANNATSVDAVKAMHALTQRIKSGAELRGVDFAEALSLIEKHAEAIDELKRAVERAISKADQNAGSDVEVDDPDDTKGDGNEADLEDFGKYLDDVKSQLHAMRKR